MRAVAGAAWHPGGLLPWGHHEKLCIKCGFLGPGWGGVAPRSLQFSAVLGWDGEEAGVVGPQVPCTAQPLSSLPAHRVNSESSSFPWAFLPGATPAGGPGTEGLARLGSRSAALARSSRNLSNSEGKDGGGLGPGPGWGGQTDWSLPSLVTPPVDSSALFP